MSDNKESTNPLTVKLSEPIEFGKRMISELNFRKPRAKDMRSIRGEMAFGDLLDIGGNLCSEPRPVMDNLCVDDAKAVVEFVGNLLGSGS